MGDYNSDSLSELPLLSIISSLDYSLTDAPKSKESITAAPPDKDSSCDDVNTNSDDSSCGTHDETRAPAVRELACDADAACKLDMSLFNFPIAIRNETVGRLPWVGTVSLPWQVVLQVLNTRYPAKPFFPKDPRLSKSIWAVFVVQKNRASCNKIIQHVAALYAKAQLEAIHYQSKSEADELIDLMNNISVRDVDQTLKLPWVSKKDPIWAGILMALDVLFATNPCLNIDDGELRMNYMRVSKYAVALVRRDKPWLAPTHVPRPHTLLHPFSTLRVALSSPSVQSSLPDNSKKRMKRKRAIFEGRINHDCGADADIEACDEDDDEDIDDEDVAPYNQKLKRARID